MSRYYYTKSKKKPLRKSIRYMGLFLSLAGSVVLLYFGLPVVSSYAFLQQASASQTITTPVPTASVLSAKHLRNIFTSTINSATQVNYDDAKNWFPTLAISPAKPRVDEYKLTIPKLGIRDAIVSTVDYDLSKHLVNYGGTAVPPDRGNAVIFGHSTLPQLFNQNNYKTIFATLHLLEKDDTISVNVDGIAYSYKIFSITVISPDDFTPLTQHYDRSTLTLITCTPPGTTWERLVIAAKLTTGE